MVPSVFAQSSSTLVFDPLPSSVQSGDEIVFSGVFYTNDGYLISDATIIIKDDVSFGADYILGTVVTDENGEFYGTWNALPRSGGGAYDFYVVFEGSSNIAYTRSQTYSVYVDSHTSTPTPAPTPVPTPAPAPIPTILKLNSLPKSVNVGDTIEFSGTLKTTDGRPIQSGTVFIKDDRDFSVDTILGTVITNDNGEFYGTWISEMRIGGGAYDFYAVYEGSPDITYSRSSTHSVQVKGDTTNIQTPLEEQFTQYDRIAPTTLRLDQIPSQVRSGDSLTFTGKLTSQGKAVSGALVYIYEDDPFKADQRIGFTRTNSNGEFSIPWKVTAGLVEIDFDIYATFNGDDSYAYARTPNQEMSVTKYGTSIKLDPFPQQAQIGETILFSGQVKIEKGNPEGFVVYIKDEDAFNADDLLTTAYVNANGKFSANWSVSDVDADGIADVYAVLEAKEMYYRSTTCDASGMTFDFGGDCQNVIPIRISGVMQPPAPPVPEEDITEERFNGNEYIEYYFNHDFKKTPLVAIVPQPDSYEKVRSSIIPAQEGIMLWTSLLEKRNGGDWNVDFEIISPGNTFSQKPDIIMNVVWYDNEIGCNFIRGVAYLTPGFTKSGEPMNTVVCASLFGMSSPTVAVSNTAAHEFIHAIGLAHAWNKPGDLMCSVEPKRSAERGTVPTCGRLSNEVNEYSQFFKIQSPSDMNLATVEHMYYKDGFKSPNLNMPIITDIRKIPKFTVDDYLGIGTSTEDNIKKLGVPAWIKNNAGWWAEGQIDDNSFVQGIQFMIKENIISIPNLPESSETAESVPAWIKNNAGWWAEGQIDDNSFVKGIEYLVKVGIIQVS